jgi:hypothetical protein
METKRHQTTPGGARLRFPLGLIVATPGVMRTLTPEDIAAALARHGLGDWGELGGTDWGANDAALACGGRLLSVYHTRGSGERFWVITEADRSVTTVLLPDEY